MTYDYLIIGAGILGAALAAEITRRRPSARILVAEKERSAAWHQTGRNSGVVHSGIYYKPGSLKVKFCRAGMAMTKAFCASHGIAYEERGKLLIATNDAEEARLDTLEQRAAENTVEARRIQRNQLKDMEPAIAGQAALHIPATAITDYTAITKALLAEVEAKGGTVSFNARVSSIRQAGDAYQAVVGAKDVSVGHIIACSGLASDRVARMLGIDPGIRILPFRGEYFVLPARLNSIVKHLIYPVPNPNLPFLGVHLTPTVNNTITVGPNAVLALAREKYGHFSFDLRDAWAALTYPGLWKMLGKHVRPSLSELKGSMFKGVYLKEAQKYCPSLRLTDLTTYRSANRAQAVQADGTLVDDFLIREVGGLVAVLNAPSPAATAAMPIASKIADDILS